ncbi:MAG: SUMF1/EgtB/PvdO family nonheme iron enzyme [Phycisphaerales bacterium]|nr:SUMF1/EgtB/PvdO family nonheme iron enzyme [Phycisphaerales bacterium]
MRSQLANITFFLLAISPSLVAAQDDGAGDGEPIQISQYPGAPFEDRNGNLWFGTVLEGLIRFDGDEFVTFTKEDGLGSDMTGGIVEDEEGILWIATSGGLTKYDGETFTTLTNYEPITVTKGWSEHGNHRHLSGVMIDSRGGMWIATMDGVFQYDGEIFTRFEMPVVAVDQKWLFTPRKVSSIYEDQGGDLWFGTDGAGAVRWDGKTMVVYTMKTHGLSSDNVSKIFQDSRGDYWFGTANGGVSHFDGKTFTTHLRSKEFSKHSGWGRYFAIHEDRQGGVWFGAAYEGGGAYRYNGESFEYFSGNPGLGAGGVPSIREDRNGNLWFGTTGGVYHYNGERFVNFTKNNPQLPVSNEPDPISLEGWAEETFDLPPGFAPDLPTGIESLLFAPGWRDPKSEDFWSYAFVMWVDEPTPEAERVKELLAGYYDGLMSTFARKKYGHVSIKPAKITVERTGPNRFEAQMNLIDAFATFEPIDIRVVIETVADEDGHSLVCIQLSHQPKEHKIWRSLDAAIKDIQAQAISLEVLKDRATYATLDQQAIENLAQSARSHWAREFSGFTYQGVEHFAAGGVSHWMSIWLHDQTGLEFVMVPGGKFQMGSPADEADRRDDELQHWVTLDPFLIARTECTQEAWAKIAGEAGVEGAPSHFKGVELAPVESVTLEDVMAWCQTTNLMLPTEAQWEFMCRSGTTTAWTMGASKNDLSRYANIGSSDCPQDWIDHPFGITEPWHDGYGDELSPVGSFAPNSFGLFDVHGNVRELCRDDLMSYEVQVEKGTGLRPGVSGNRVVRGGSFNHASRIARSARRVKRVASAHRMVGFRPSLDLPFRY